MGHSLITSPAQVVAVNNNRLMSSTQLTPSSSVDIRTTALQTMGLHVSQTLNGSRGHFLGPVPLGDNLWGTTGDRQDYIQQPDTILTGT